MYWRSPWRAARPTANSPARSCASRVRKKAIFWLGECGDPRAVETLVEIVKKN